MCVRAKSHTRAPISARRRSGGRRARGTRCALASSHLRLTLDLLRLERLLTERRGRRLPLRPVLVGRARRGALATHRENSPRCMARSRRDTWREFAEMHGENSPRSMQTLSALFDPASSTDFAGPLERAKGFADTLAGASSSASESASPPSLFASSSSAGAGSGSGSGAAGAAGAAGGASERARAGWRGGGSSISSSTSMSSYFACMVVVHLGPRASKRAKRVQ